MMPSNSLPDLELQKCLQERGTEKNKFMTSGLEREDASAKFSIWLSTDELHREYYSVKYVLQKASWS